MLIEKTVEEFKNEAEELIENAIYNDDFVKIKTNAGNAILINEAEWNILRDTFKQAIK